MHKKQYINHNNITFPDHGNLTGDECYELIKIYKDESKSRDERIQARNVVIEHHHKFIASSVKSFCSHHKDKNFGDLWMAANEGFIEAFNKVDLDRLKYEKFYTYAAWWIKAYITVESTHSGIIKYSDSCHKDMNKDHKKTREECKHLSPVQASHRWNDYFHKWFAMQNNAGPNMESLDHKIDPDGDNTIADVTSIDEADGTMNIAGRNILMQELHKTMDRALSPVEKRILASSYGINSEKTNLKELGKELNITKNDVKKIKDNAIIKMRKDKGLKKAMASIGIMTSVSTGKNVFSLFN